MACAARFIWIQRHGLRSTKSLSPLSLPLLPSPLRSFHLYIIPSCLKSHYFTAGRVRGGPCLWTLCRCCINQTSHTEEGTPHPLSPQTLTAHLHTKDKENDNKITHGRMHCGIQCCYDVCYIFTSSYWLFIVLSFPPPDDNRIFAWGNGTSGQ